MEYYSAIKKKWNHAIRNNMEGPKGYNTKWSQSEKQKQILYDFTHTWNLKTKQMNKYN